MLDGVLWHHRAAEVMGWPKAQDAAGLARRAACVLFAGMLEARPGGSQ